jgi:penicillin amidase
VPPGQEEIANSVAATIYSVWRGEFIRATVDATLDRFDLPTPDADQALSSLRRLLERFAQDRGRGVSGLDFFAVTGVSDANDRRDVILLRSLAGALDLLAGDEFRAAFGGSTDQDDYRWGRLHRVVFEHPLGGDRNAPPLGNFATVGDPPGIPTDGGFNTVDASGHNGRANADDEFGFGGGPVRRYVGRADPDGIVGVSSLPGGASGLTESPYAVNLLGRWLTNETFPQELDAADFGRRAVDVQNLAP